MAGIDFRPDRGGYRHVLKSQELAAEINQLAERIAANAHHTTQAGVQLPVVVDEYTTDRAAASVTIAHPAGLAAQAKHGVLTRAAASVGLEVKEK